MVDLNSLWGVVTVVGPILLLAALAWAALHNRNSDVSEAKTEAATARMYDEQSREDDLNA